MERSFEHEDNDDDNENGQEEGQKGIGYGFSTILDSIMSAQGRSHFGYARLEPDSAIRKRRDKV